MSSKRNSRDFLRAFALTLELVRHVRGEVDAVESANLDAEPDAEFLIDSITGETNALEFGALLAEDWKENTAEAAGLKAKAESYAAPLLAKAAAAEARANKIGEMLVRLASVVDVTPLPICDADGVRLVSLQYSRGAKNNKAVVDDPTELPQGFYDIKPRLAEIAKTMKAGEKVPGARLVDSPGGWRICK